MKILYLARSLGVGGAERQLILQARGLAARGHDVTVATFYGGGALEASAREGNVRLLEIGKSGRWNIFSFVRRLVTTVRREAPDVVHGMLVVPNIILATLKPLLGGARVVWGVRASKVELAHYELLESLTFQLSRPLSRLADGIIVNSHAGAQFHAARGYPRARMRTILNGIDTTTFAPNDAAGRRVRAELGISPSCRVIGTAARLDPMKGLEVLLHAMAFIKNDQDKVRFVVVGEGSTEYRKSLLGLARALGIEEIVIWAGRRADMPAVYNAFDVLCSPSVYGEGFSNAIGEAMACGIPCVATDVGDASIVVGATGRVVPPNDPLALAEAIRGMLATPPGSLKPRARAHILEIASVERLMRETEAALQDAIR